MDCHMSFFPHVLPAFLFPVVQESLERGLGRHLVMSPITVKIIWIVVAPPSAICWIMIWEVVILIAGILERVSNHVRCWNWKRSWTWHSVRPVNEDIPRGKRRHHPHAWKYRLHHWRRHRLCEYRHRGFHPGYRRHHNGIRLGYRCPRWCVGAHCRACICAYWRCSIAGGRLGNYCRWRGSVASAHRGNHWRCSVACGHRSSQRARRWWSELCRRRRRFSLRVAGCRPIE